MELLTWAGSTIRRNIPDYSRYFPVLSADFACFRLRNISWTCREPPNTANCYESNRTGNNTSWQDTVAISFQIIQLLVTTLSSMYFLSCICFMICLARRKQEELSKCAAIPKPTVAISTETAFVDPDHV